MLDKLNEEDVVLIKDILYLGPASVHEFSKKDSEIFKYVSDILLPLIISGKYEDYTLKVFILVFDSAIKFLGDDSNSLVGCSEKDINKLRNKILTLQ